MSFDRIERLEAQHGYADELVCDLGSIASAAGGIVSGIMGYNAANDAAQAQQNAAQKGIDALTGANSTVQTGYQPYQTAGTTALNALTNTVSNPTQFKMSDFYNDPGYQFALTQGQNAINSNAAAKGNALSGGTQKALAAYTTGLANQTYNDAYSRYLAASQQNYNQQYGVASLGLNAQNSSAQSTLGTAQGVSNLYTQQGNAQAAGIIGQQNAINGAIGAVTGAANQYSFNNSVRPSASQVSILGQIL